MSKPKTAYSVVCQECSAPILPGIKKWHLFCRSKTILGWSLKQYLGQDPTIHVPTYTLERLSSLFSTAFPLSKRGRSALMDYMNNIHGTVRPLDQPH